MIMEAVTGITVEKSYTGTPKTISFDFQQYGDALIRFFKSEGIDIPYSPYDKKEADKLLRIKSDMDSGMRKKVEMSNFWDD
jgi:hypothetical protein